MRQIVHEAETQRQHARYKLPLKVFFKGKLYKVADWSVGGIGIVGIDADSDAEVGAVSTFRIIFPSRNGFNFSLARAADSISC